MRFYSIFMEEQNSVKFRKICNLFVIKKENKINKIYVPYFVTNKMNMIDTKEKKIQIDLEKDETYDGFMGFLEDFVSGINHIDFLNKFDLEKYSISKKCIDKYYSIIPLSMKKGYYDVSIMSYKGEKIEQGIKERNELMKKYCVIIELVLKQSNDRFINEILGGLLAEFREEELYELKCKYDIPNVLFQGKSLKIKLGHNYNINILVLFDYLLFVYKTYGGEWIHEYYSYIKILKTDSKFKWMISKPIEQKHEGEIRKGFFKNEKVEYTEYISFGSSASFNKIGQPKFDSIFENIMNLQNDIEFQSCSHLVTLIDDNNMTSTIYIPNDILIELDKNYFDSITSGNYLSNNYDIILTENESYLSFLLFLKDYLQFTKDYLEPKKITITLNTILDIQRLFVADRFNYLDIYDFSYSTNIKTILSLLSSNFDSSTVVDKIIIKLISRYTDYSSLFNLSIPYHLLSELYVTVTADDYSCYDIKFLSYFKGIKVNINVHKRSKYTDTTSYTASIIRLSDYEYSITLQNIRQTIDPTKFSKIIFQKSLQPLFK